jgi:hypothetical protein
MEKFLQMLSSLIERIEDRSPRIETGEGYLLNNLRRFKEVSESSTSQHEFVNAERILGRFSLDSTDWDDPLCKEITAMTKQARRVKP